MSTPDLYEVAFEWPHPEPTTVIVTGTFDEWSCSVPLTRVADGFVGSTKIPYGEKIKFKYVVDGKWVLHEDQVTETDPGGFVNHVFTAPAAPPTIEAPPAALGPEEVAEPVVDEAPIANGHAGNGHSEVVEAQTKHADEADEVPAEEIAQESKVVSDSEQPAPVVPSSGFSPSLSDIADTIAARDGTSSALGYVASGLGAAMHSVVGVDLVNIQKIAIPTPKVDDAFTLPNGQESVPDSAALPAESTPSTAVDTEIPVISSPVAPRVPITIVPVNAAENNTVASPPPEETEFIVPAPVVESAIPVEAVPEATIASAEDVVAKELSTHEPVVLQADVPTPIEHEDKVVVEDEVSAPKDLLPVAEPVAAVAEEATPAAIASVSEEIAPAAPDATKEILLVNAETVPEQPSAIEESPAEVKVEELVAEAPVLIADPVKEEDISAPEEVVEVVDIKAEEPATEDTSAAVELKSDEPVEATIIPLAELAEETPDLAVAEIEAEEPAKEAAVLAAEPVEETSALAVEASPAVEEENLAAAAVEEPVAEAKVEEPVQVAIIPVAEPVKEEETTVAAIEETKTEEQLTEVPAVAEEVKEAETVPVALDQVKTEESVAETKPEAPEEAVPVPEPTTEQTSIPAVEIKTEEPVAETKVEDPAKDEEPSVIVVHEPVAETKPEETAEEAAISNPVEELAPAAPASTESAIIEESRVLNSNDIAAPAATAAPATAAPETLAADPVAAVEPTTVEPVVEVSDATAALASNGADVLSKVDEKPITNGSATEASAATGDNASKDEKNFPVGSDSPAASTDNSPSSSKFNSTRKKRTSLFGKLKHIFQHDKEKEKK